MLGVYVGLTTQLRKIICCEICQEGQGQHRAVDPMRIMMMIYNLCA
jgi:hypothetical protein